jgi:sigma-B regulation protein RsbU (phosphoserine phosphatase)
MTPPFRLPQPAEALPPGRVGRLKLFLLRSWTGRVLLAAAALLVLEALGVPLPGLLGGLARAVVFLLGGWLLARVALRLLRRLFWRIRTKLLVSYLFIAVVPVVLMALFFLLAGVLFSGVVGGHLVSSEIDAAGHELEAVARLAMTTLSLDDPKLAVALDRRLDDARRLHPGLGFALVRRGRVLAEGGEAPRELPAWFKAPGFSGLVKGEGMPVLRALWAQGDAFLALQVPVDAQLLAPLEQKTGIRLGGAATIHTQKDGIEIRSRTREEGSGGSGGMSFVVPVDQTDWATGTQELDALEFRFAPLELIRRLTPGSINTADLIVKALTAVAVVFLVMYAVALLVGLLLARSVTASVHALSVGTQRLRSGDFTHPIPVRSRDQLGELADSFNVMARGIQDLLREQAEKERLEEELRIARRIQMSLLPAEGAGDLAGLRVAALCLPAAEVGGDYYDLLPLSETRMGVLVADVSGKGTSAALYMAELKGLVMSLSRMYDSPAKLLAEANRILAASMDPRTFITMTYAVVDIAAGRMRYARAGHNPIIQLEAATGATRVLAPPGMGLGMDPGARFEEILEEAEVPLASGDVFLLFTDGLSEAMNVRSELFGEERLRDLLAGALEGDEVVLKDRILAEIRSFVGEAAQHDDMTMVILKVV